mgnify:CR=1 FL=1
MMKRRQFIAAASALPLLGCEQSRQIVDIQGGFTGVNFERGHVLRGDLLSDAKSWAAPSKIRKTKIIIAGGGVAGLAAARALRLQGINDFVVLELEDRAGGNSKGGAVSGKSGSILCPLGAHYLPVPSEQAPQAADLRIGRRRNLLHHVILHRPQFFGTGGGRGTRSVASYDEDTTTMGVEAARLALSASDARPAALWFATALSSLGTPYSSGFHCSVAYCSSSGEPPRMNERPSTRSPCSPPLRAHSRRSWLRHVVCRRWRSRWKTPPSRSLCVIAAIATCPPVSMTRRSDGQA